MKKRTIVFVYHTLNIGGVEKELLAYASHLDVGRYNLHIALTRAEGELLSSIPSYIQLHNVPGDSFTPGLTYLVNLYQTLKTVNPDAVVGFMQDICFNILLLRMLTPLNYKTIVSEQIVLSQWQKLKRTPLVKRMLIKFLYKKADACFAQSESIMEDLKNNWNINPKRLYLVPSYVSPKEVKKISKKITSNSFRSQYFLYVGRLAPEKNIEVLLHAFHFLHQTHPNIRLLIAGPKTSSYYDNICKGLKIENAVRFLGYIANPNQHYRRALALVIPSLVEGRSRVMVEAMITGCPVITADFTGHERYIKHMDTGLVFSKNSPLELTHSLIYALNHPRELRSIAKRAKIYITKAHIRTHVRNYETTLNSAVENVFRRSPNTATI